MKKSEALAYYKTQINIAERLTEAGYRITQPAVSKWGELIPEVPARILSELSGGALMFDPSDYREDVA